MKTKLVLLLLTVTASAAYSQSPEEKRQIDSIVTNIDAQALFYSVNIDSNLIYGDADGKAKNPLGFVVEKFYYDSLQKLKKVFSYRTFETYEEMYYYKDSLVIKAIFTRYDSKPRHFYYTFNDNVLTEKETGVLSLHLWRKYFFGTKENTLYAYEKELLYNTYWHYKQLGYAKSDLRRKNDKN